MPGKLVDYVALEPVATFFESEGLTLVLVKSVAEKAGLAFELAGNKVKANEMYTIIMDDYSRSAEGRDIERYIGRTE